MTIRTQLRLVLGLGFCVCLAISAVLWHAQRTSTDALRQLDVARQVVTAVFELDQVVYDAVYFGGERAYEQTRNRYSSLAALLTAGRSVAVVHDPHDAGLRSAYGRIGILLARLERLKDSAPGITGAQGGPNASDHYRHVVQQVLAQSRRMSTAAIKMQTLALDKVEEKRWQLHGAIIAFVVTMLLLLAFTSAYVGRKISIRIRTLTSAVARIHDQHDFTARVPVGAGDELGQFAAALNATLDAIRQRDDALRSSEERYRSLVERSPLGICEIDAAGRLLAVNDAGEALLGSPTAHAAGDTTGAVAFIDALDPDEREQVESHIARSLEGAALVMEVRTPREDAERTLSVRLVPLSGDGDASGRLLAHLEDVTQMRRAEQEMARYRDRLATLVRERTAALEEAQAELVQAEALAAVGRSVTNPV